MKNTLTDLNNHLFEQLERLNDDELDDAQLDKELRRAEGMTKVATQIIKEEDVDVAVDKLVEKLIEAGVIKR